MLKPFIAALAPDNNRGVQFLVAHRLDYITVEVFADNIQAAGYAVRKGYAFVTLADAAARIEDAKVGAL